MAIRLRRGRLGANKYNAQRTVKDGVPFASAREAVRYSQLKLLERSGSIRSLQLQPRFDIVIEGVHCGFYKADFSYTRKNGKVVVEDVKGVSTPLYRFKKKIIEALYGIKIVEIR